MSATASNSASEANTDDQHPALAELSEKQRSILSYLRERVPEKTYFKSRVIADELGLSAKEVGTNMPALRENDVGVEVEKWGYSSSTTWMVTAGA